MLQRAARKAGTGLPKDGDAKYSFSFSDVRPKVSFAPETLAPMAFQLAQIESISHVLFDSKVHSINGIKRPEVAVAEEEVEEDEIQSTETNLDEIVEVEEVVEAVEEEEVADVPFAVIEDVPIFPGCENLKNNNERKACMSEKISKYVNKEFDTDLGSELGLSGINRVIVQFRIDEKGNIGQVRARAPHPRLEKEAARVINSLPKMKPGKQRGKPVGVMYSLPIAFKVQD